MSNNSTPLYTLGYFFSVDHPTEAQSFLNYLLQVLRTSSPDAPEGNQPEMVEGVDNTVAFVEVLAPKHIPALHAHLQAVVVAVCNQFHEFSQIYPGASKLGITVHMRRDTDNKHAALITEMPDGSKTDMIFGYQVDLGEGAVMTEDSITMMPNGKDVVNAVLAYFGELENGTGEVKH